MSRPRLLDLFCGAGGAAMGYHRAGFDVVGVDIAPQPHFPFTFVQADAMTYPLDGFDAIHASPPCQHYANVTRWRGDQRDHPALIAPLRALLASTGLPWVIENVRTKELRSPFVLCGSMFGLAVRRHRYFETNWAPFRLMPSCQHAGLLPFMHKGERAYADAMGCTWMNNREAREAIPPAYTRMDWCTLAAVLREDRCREDGATRRLSAESRDVTGMSPATDYAASIGSGISDAGRQTQHLHAIGRLTSIPTGTSTNGSKGSGRACCNIVSSWNRCSDESSCLVRVCTTGTASKRTTAPRTSNCGCRGSRTGAALMTLLPSLRRSSPGTGEFIGAQLLAAVESRVA